MAETYTYRPPLIPDIGLSGLIVRGSDEAAIPCDLENRDYAAFLAWLNEPGNTAPEGWTGPTSATPATG